MTAHVGGPGPYRDVAAVPYKSLAWEIALWEECQTCIQATQVHPATLCMPTLIPSLSWRGQNLLVFLLAACLTPLFLEAVFFPFSEGVERQRERHRQRCFAPREASPFSGAPGFEPRSSFMVTSVPGPSRCAPSPGYTARSREADATHVDLASLPVWTDMSKHDLPYGQANGVCDRSRRGPRAWSPLPPRLPTAHPSTRLSAKTVGSRWRGQRATPHQPPQARHRQWGAQPDRTSAQILRDPIGAPDSVTVTQPCSARRRPRTPRLPPRPAEPTGGSQVRWREVHTCRLPRDLRQPEGVVLGQDIPTGGLRRDTAAQPGVPAGGGTSAPSPWLRGALPPTLGWGGHGTRPKAWRDTAAQPRILGATSILPGARREGGTAASPH